MTMAENALLTKKGNSTGKQCSSSAENLIISDNASSSLSEDILMVDNSFDDSNSEDNETGVLPTIKLFNQQIITKLPLPNIQSNFTISNTKTNGVHGPPDVVCKQRVGVPSSTEDGRPEIKRNANKQTMPKSKSSSESSFSVPINVSVETIAQERLYKSCPNPKVPLGPPSKLKTLNPHTPAPKKTRSHIQRKGRESNLKLNTIKDVYEAYASVPPAKIPMVINKLRGVLTADEETLYNEYIKKRHAKYTVKTTSSLDKVIQTEKKKEKEEQGCKLEFLRTLLDMDDEEKLQKGQEIQKYQDINENDAFCYKTDKDLGLEKAKTGKSDVKDKTRKRQNVNVRDPKNGKPKDLKQTKTFKGQNPLTDNANTSHHQSRQVTQISGDTKKDIAVMNAKPRNIAASNLFPHRRSVSTNTYSNMFFQNRIQTQEAFKRKLQEDPFRGKKLRNARFVHYLIDQMVCQYKGIAVPKQLKMEMMEVLKKPKATRSVGKDIDHMANLKSCASNKWYDDDYSSAHTKSEMDIIESSPYQSSIPYTLPKMAKATGSKLDIQSPSCKSRKNSVGEQSIHTSGHMYSNAIPRRQSLMDFTTNPFHLPSRTSLTCLKSTEVKPSRSYERSTVSQYKVLSRQISEDFQGLTLKGPQRIDSCYQGKYEMTATDIAPFNTGIIPSRTSIRKHSSLIDNRVSQLNSIVNMSVKKTMSENDHMSLVTKASSGTLYKSYKPSPRPSKEQFQSGKPATSDTSITDIALKKAKNEACKEIRNKLRWLEADDRSHKRTN